MKFDDLESLKETIRSAPISSIIQSFIPLTKRGINFEGICPFHPDTRPSLKVNDQKNLYKCFVCDNAGDVYKFVMDYKKCNFIDALKYLANELGLTFPEIEKKIDPAIQESLECTQIALDFYLDQTTKNNPPEFQIFLEDRKLDETTVQDFNICFSSGYHDLADYLQRLSEKTTSKNFYERALQLGLIKNGDRGHYDTFRRRILFPITNPIGKVVGFSSRSIEEKQLPKYLNSQEGPIFQKKNILFGLHRAKKFIKERDLIFIVEGHMDAIMMHQQGMQNTVALMGTSFSDFQLKTLKNLSQNFILLLDQDAAGFQASKKFLPQFLKYSIFPKMIDLSPAKDPDEFLVKFGRIEFDKRVALADNALDFFCQKEIESIPLPHNTENKLLILRNIMSLISVLGEKMEAFERLSLAAEKLQLKVPSELLLQNYRDFRLGQKNTFPLQENLIQTDVISNKILDQELHSETKSTFSPIDFDKNGDILMPMLPWESAFLKHLLLNPDIVKIQDFTEIAKFVKNIGLAEIIGGLPRLLEEIDINEFPSTVLTLLERKGFPKKEWGFIQDMLFDWEYRPRNYKINLKEFQDLLKKVKLENLKIEKEELKIKFSNKQIAENELLKNIHEIDKKIFTLKKEVTI